MSDPIADMIARIKNAQMAKHRTVQIPHSNLKEKFAEILEQEGYVTDTTVSGEIPQKVITLQLKYDRKESMISHFKRVSKPGLRRYINAKDLVIPLNGYGTGVITTSKGLMSIKEAKKQNLGGEIMCEIW